MITVRFWFGFAAAIVVGLLALALLMRLGGWGDPKSGLVWYALMTIPRVILVMIALFLAITLGSIVWNAFYWATIAPSLFKSKPLELADFGRSDKGDDATHSRRENPRNPGTLREFLALKDDPEFRIGIILAGGGAKGVYQAGAMQAIWEFLEREGALGCVRMIAGTSIGSWNAMFWLTGQVSAPGAARGPLYEWWTSARTSTVVNPTVYAPVLWNYLAGTKVWREQFKQLFVRKPEPLPFFYFTRTNVQHASLEYSTNRKPLPISPGQLPNYRECPNADRSHDQLVGLDQVESAVFASMDIPPAFKRLRDRNGYEYEDGGVIDNLPIQFATWCEGCNLLFVLPLNATFNARTNRYSILARMARVLDVRQGALERDSLKDISLYNQLIEATREGGRPSKVHKYATTTFCICPAPQLDVNTFGFWSLKRHAKECYDLMYKATCSELKKFDFSIGNADVRMAQVQSDGSVLYEDFTLESEPARPKAPVNGDIARS